MKRIVFGVAAFASVLGTSALAADLPVKAPPLPVAVYNWTVFYVGGNIGYSWGRSDSSLLLLDAGTIVSAANAKFDMDGVIGGGQIGYNWQRDKWVFGLEADIQGSDQKGSTTTTCAGPTVFANNNAIGPCSLGHLGDTAPGNAAALPVIDALSQKLDWFGTVRGRIGSTFIAPTFLAYVTGGLAYGDVKTTNTVSGANFPGQQGVGTTPPPPVLVAATMSNSSVRVGWTIGAGVEGVVTGNWTAKLEYLYMDLGDVSGTFVTPVVAPSGGFLRSSYNSHITDNILRVGVNYRFAGPVVARY